MSGKTQSGKNTVPSGENSQKEAPTKAKRSHNRGQQLQDAAARLFATKGYKETTLRDIGSEIGMLPGSVYYHFKSKQELLLAVYSQAVSSIRSRLQQAMTDDLDPWQKLEQAMIAHVETILDQDDYARVMIGVLPDKAPEIEQELTELRDSYEAILIELIDELPLRPDVDKKLLRLMLLGAANSAQNWYKEGSTTPKEIAQGFIRFLKEPVTP